MNKKALLTLQLLKQMESIKYGYIDHQQKKHFDADDQFAAQYFLQTPKQLNKSQIGVCWDQVEYQREFFSNHQIPCKTLAIIANQNESLPSHSMLYFKTASAYCWFEHSWAKYRGLWYFESKKILYQQLAARFLLDLKHYQSWKIVQFHQPMFGVSSDQYHQHLNQSEIILQGRSNKTPSLFD